ncbi:SBF-like CPA transporter family-domain-containing protein [Dipodascopsis uninucleata]
MDEDDKIKKSRMSFLRRITWREVLQFIINYWFLGSLGIAILIAYLVPNLGRSGGWIAAQYSIIYVCPAMIFFISGLTIDTTTLAQAIALYRIHIVAQTLSYLFASALFFVFAYAAIESNNSHINTPVMAGVIMLGCTPTTIGSNVVFTRSAHGNAAATLIEVTIANLISPFLTPALIGMYMTSSPKWGVLRPGTSGGGYSVLYRSVFKQLGLTVFVPLFAGQVLRNLFPSMVKRVTIKLKVNKWASIFLIFIMWSAFSTSFYTGAFKSSTAQTKALVLLLGIGLYWIFVGVSLALTRGSHKIHFKNKYLDAIVGFFRFSKRDTIAICYVVPAKTPALGVPLVTALYSHAAIGEKEKSMLLIPMILYQIEQLTFSNLTIPLFRRWVEDEEEAMKADETSKSLGTTQQSQQQQQHQSEHPRSTTESDDNNSFTSAVMSISGDGIITETCKTSHNANKSESYDVEKAR